jgi:DNA-binding transcriptional MerR regulator
MTTYHLSEVARKTGLHPNTIRRYIRRGLISKPVREWNNWQVFNQTHIDQLLKLGSGRSSNNFDIGEAIAKEFRIFLAKNNRTLEQAVRKIGISKKDLARIAGPGFNAKKVCRIRTFNKK